MDLDSLRVWARSRLAAHKIPTRLLVVSDLPRNAISKVIRSKVRALFPKEVS